MLRRTLKYKLPISFDSKEYFKRAKLETYGLFDREVSLDFGNEEALSTPPPEKPTFPVTEALRAAALKHSKSMSQDIDDDGGFVDVGSEVAGAGNGAQSIDQEPEEQLETQTVLRFLEEGDKITHMFRVARIQGLDIFEGLLLFGREHFYLIDGFTLLKTREIRDIDSLAPNAHEPVVPTTSPTGSRPQSKSQTKKICQKFAYEDIKEVHKRRYLLQPIALEVFSMDGRNSLLVFPRKLRNKVYGRFMSVATYITDAQDSLAGQKRSASVESGNSLLSGLIGETSVTQRWVRGEISNFQYLMHLNTLAGRSYNGRF